MVLHVARGSFREVSAVEDALGWKAEWKSVQDGAESKHTQQREWSEQRPCGKVWGSFGDQKGAPNTWSTG